MSKVLLNLDTLTVRPRISIDGSKYEILSPDELTVLESHRLALKGKRLEALSKQDELTAAEEGELGELVREISDKIMEPVPDAIRAKLSDSHRLSVIQAFTTLLLTKTAGTAAATLIQALLPPKSSTGGKARRASSGSTAGRRRTGSAKPRSRS